MSVEQNLHGLISGISSTGRSTFHNDVFSDYLYINCQLQLIEWNMFELL